VIRIVRALLSSRVFLVAIGLGLLALIIWFAGPYIAFADFKPFEGAAARLVAILVLAVAYAAYVQLRQLRAARAGEKLAAEVTKADGPEAGDSRDSAALRKRFEEAVETLRRSSRKGSRNLYDLPWYIIIGPPGAGKTTVLVNSGLNFPLAQKFGKEALRGVGGTRNCDWWFTDEAILLDTAGRYTTQDSDAHADAAGWSAFLKLLRKFRARQPINGCIVAVSAADLLALSERERTQHLNALRERLDELGRDLRIDVPVYFVVTKCDLVAGFAEFFDDLGQEARAQVWGTTFPIEVTESGGAPQAFAREFDRLIERLQQRVLARMESERDTRRRAAILAFPQQVSALKPPLQDLLTSVFVTSGFDRKVLLRGVYFTSGTQEGSPVDRMLAAIARTFGVTSAVTPPPAGRGKAYFIQRLLKSVIFGESGLAGINRVQQWRKIVAQSAAYIACVIVLALGLAGLFVSYGANAVYIDAVSEAAKRVTAAQQSLTGILSVDRFLPELDALRDLTTTAEQYKGHVPWHMRMGLYRGGSLGEEARDAYTRELNSVLVPTLSARFAQALQLQVTKPDALYEYLKGYLMLGSAQHRDPEHLRYLSRLEWHRLYAGDPTLAQALGDHFEELLVGDRLSSVPIDDQAIAQARIALRNTAQLPVLMYDRLKLSYLDDRKRAVRLDIAAGTGAEVLVRRSGRPLSDPVPALYTRAVFNEVNNHRRYELVEEFAQDSWVLGDTPLELRDSARYIADVMSLYEADYIATWDSVLQDLSVTRASDAQQFTDMLGVIASPASPLKGLLLVIASNTNLLAPDTTAEAQAKSAANQLLEAKLATLKKLVGEPPEGAPVPGSRVTKHFEALRNLVEGPPGQTPLDQILRSLDEQYQRLKATGTGVGQKSALDPSVQAEVSSAKQSLAQAAKQMPGPVGEIVADLATRTESIVDTGARSELERLYTTQVVRDCEELVGGRYPLDPAAASDASLADFAHTFGPGGTFDAFFRDHLAALVDTSRTPWHWREGAAAGPNSMLAQFQRVQRIRDIFFGAGSASPEAHFNLVADSLDASVSRFRLDFDGQSFEYAFGPLQSRPMTWPGSVGSAYFSFDTPHGPIPGNSEQGPWAWFRLLDRAKRERVSDIRYRITFSAGGKSMRLVLEAASVRNPFGRNEVAGFRCAM
jgi:type VI secretion system protein ImpL